MFTRQHRAAVSLVVALTLAPALGQPSGWFSASARAELTAELKAKQAYARGAELYKERRFAEAAAAFAEGYSNKPHHAFLWNLALAYRALLDHPRAIEYYQRYLAACPADATADRAAAQAALAEEQRGLRERSQPPAAEPATRTATRMASRTAPVTPTEPALSLGHATDDTARPGERQIWRKWWFWTATGAALAAVGVGVGLGVGLAPGSTAPYKEVTWR